jgi:acyl-CoA synthetase (AMP-forming)/AMP-acid ligase II
MLGAAYLGAVFMPLNWRLAPPEIAYIVNHSGAVVLVSEPELDPLVAPVQRELDCRNLVRIGPVDDGPWISFDAVCDASDPLPGAVAMRPDDLLRLMYTSGTTSRPKGVMITCGNLDAKCLAHCVELGFTQDDRGLIAGPLYHVGALDLTFTTLLYVGAFQRVLRSFDARAVLSHIEAERITTVWLAPVMVKLVLEESASSHHDLSSLRVLIDGGEKMPLPLIDGILATFPHAWFADAYGLTETVSGDTFLDKGKERSKLGSVGRPVFNVDVQIMGPDGTVVPPGEDGEIVLRGPKVFSGYWRDPEATAAALRDGWFHTGDVGMLDSDGYVYVIDRLKDMILSGGENISSLEVERVLYEHPRVVEAAVVGRPHSRWGEVPVAYVVARDADLDVDELIEFCVLRLARFKVPKAVRVVASLPRNPSGKVLKRLLRESESQTAAEVPDPS